MDLRVHQRKIHLLEQLDMGLMEELGLCLTGQAVAVAEQDLQALTLHQIMVVQVVKESNTA
jgi:hypothetical protein